MASIMMGWVVISKKFTSWCRNWVAVTSYPLLVFKPLTNLGLMSFILYRVTANQYPEPEPVTGNW